MQSSLKMPSERLERESNELRGQKVSLRNVQTRVTSQTRWLNLGQHQWWRFQQISWDFHIHTLACFWSHIPNMRLDRSNSCISMCFYGCFDELTAIPISHHSMPIDDQWEFKSAPIDHWLVMDWVHSVSSGCYDNATDPTRELITVSQRRIRLYENYFSK